MNKFYIETKEKECYPFDTWITKLEMRAFGWTVKDDEIEYLDEYDVTIDYDRSTANIKQRFKFNAIFKRVEPYSNSGLFDFLEVIMSIFSWIRRKLIILLSILDLFFLVIGLLFVFNGAGMNEYLAIGLYLLLSIYLPSLIIAILGFTVRKILRLDKKLKDSLEENGYRREQNL